jgi:hypothetical protein
MAEGNPLKMWRLIPQYGKKDQLAVELALKQFAKRAGLTHQAPIVMPEFSKRLLSLNFAGNDPNSLSEGVQPFSLVIVDHQSQQSRDSMACTLVTRKQPNTI